jgi:hypothetical protein
VMEPIEAKSKEDAIAKARAYVERLYCCKAGDRKWLVGVAPDSYTNERYRVEIHVLEGSPAKGYVVVSDRCPNSGLALATDYAFAHPRQWQF